MARFFTLNTGAQIPSVALGTWHADPGVVGEAVASAIKTGYRHIDTARIYRNEKEQFVVSYPNDESSRNLSGGLASMTDEAKRGLVINECQM